MKRIIALVFVVLSCLGCKHRGGKKMLLRLNYNLGEKTDIKYRTYVVTGNEKDEPEINQYIRLGLKVDSVVHDSLYVLFVKYDYLRVKNGGLGGEEYSSDKDEADMSGFERQMHQRVKPLLDSTYKLTINKRGQVIKPLSFAGGQKIPQEYALIDFKSYFVAFPQDSVAIGDEWTNEKDMPQLKVSLKTTCYIESIYNNIIQIKVKGRLDMATGPSREFSGLYLISEKTKQLMSTKIELGNQRSSAKAVIDIEAR